MNVLKIRTEPDYRMASRIHAAQFWMVLPWFVAAVMSFPYVLWTYRATGLVVLPLAAGISIALMLVGAALSKALTVLVDHFRYYDRSDLNALPWDDVHATAFAMYHHYGRR